MTDRPIDVDVLVVGGGIQGITLLHELAGAGAGSTLLASATALGTGETLHSHGYLHHGYTMSAAGLSAEPLVSALRESAAWWKDRITPVDGDVLHALPEGAAAERTRIWDQLGLAYRAVTEISDALRGGSVDAPGVSLFSIEDRLVSMRDILADMSAPLQERIVRARVTDVLLDAEGKKVIGCTLRNGRHAIRVRPRVLLVASGREAQPLLRAARTPSGHTPLDARCRGLNRIRFVPMLLVRGDHLPPVSGIFEPQALSVLRHPLGTDRSVWILTLTEGHEASREDFDPEREKAPGGRFVTEAVSRLCALVPEAALRRDADLQFGFYFGGKIDHPQGGNGRFTDDCGLSNLRLAWPGVWSLSLANSREIVDSLRAAPEISDIFDRRAPLDLAGEGLASGADVGEELRLTDAVTWHGWSEFRTIHEGA